MKNKLIFFLFTVCLTFYPCQTCNADFQIGLKGGMCMPFFTGAGYDEFVSGWTINGEPVQTKAVLTLSSIGVFFCIGLSDFLALQPEFYYLSAGGCFGNDYGYLKDQASYLETILLVKGRINLYDWTLSFFAGPDLLIRVGDANINLYAYPDVFYSTAWSWDTSYLNPLILNAVAGVELTLDLSQYLQGLFISIDIRYMLGITERFIPEMDMSWQQHNITLAFGAGFQL